MVESEVSPARWFESGASVRIGTGLLVCSTRRVVVRAGFPEDLAKDAEKEIGVGGGEVETADEAANFFVGGGGSAALLGGGGRRFEVAAGDQRVEES